ncbi:aminoacyl-tRNA hydrolase [Rickettsiales endosymbiont of Peranema trichophorum]|uniref:aminoacyl-tRNA hydrolase n=1 Tax=Rickettsiales endosymbiont of Peranema trichophorum TaxID=2486577 RepID=UPI001022D4C4|nr:aminoacyl-tRNA hydrolase [Rickettsiales endosymbiont of Peranema trichophorum]RZI47555.1 aminoacyl-tRNA hydrolase [Rickettsiales endosymbiont of Peranema trichophorum]
MTYKLIVGLGNPDQRYERTRHNYGFLVIDEIAKHFDFPKFTRRFHGEMSSHTIFDQKVFLLKPQTYMNRSGVAVQEVLQFYKFAPSELIVIHDDLDIAFGKIKIKSGGGNGGHNGLKSIDELIGVEYTRMRLGISKPTYSTDVSDYVLSTFTQEELKDVEGVTKFIAQHIDLLLANKHSNFLSKYVETVSR